MKRNIIYLILCSILIVFWGCATTTSEVKESLEPQEASVITGIDIEDYLLTITVNKPFIYTIYRPGDPYKLVVELPDVGLGAFNNKIVSDKAGITEIVPSQIESPSLMAKIEMLLPVPSTVDHEYKDGVLKIGIKEEIPQQLAELLKEREEEKRVTEAEPAVAEEKPLPKATEISNISFESSADIVKVLIKGNGSMTPNIFPLEGRIVIDIPDVVMNTTLPSDVVSPVKGIRSGKHEDKIRLVLDLKEKTNFDVASFGDSIVVALQKLVEKPPAAPIAEVPVEREVAEVKEPEALVEGQYVGKKLSLDFQDADIIPIFRLLADISGYNIVVSPDVKGKLTMKLINVPWDQALDLILKTFSLGKSVEGNIIRIAPHTVLTRELEEAEKARDAEKRAGPIETEIFPLSYAEGKDIERAIKDAKILSTKGNVSFDERTSSLIINDAASVFPKVQKLLETLDKPTPQVLIEARIVEVSTSDVRDLGIQWGGFFKGSDGLSSVGGYSGLTPGTFTGENFIVDFPGGAGATSGTGFTLGILNPAKTMGLDLQLAAVEDLGKGKVISNPRIMTVDNGKAKILQGKSIPVRRLTTEGTVSTEFKDVTLELNVEPHITPDNSISMGVEIRKEELDPAGVSIEGVPSTVKNEAKTEVIIRDGETIVIGGIYKINRSESEAGVPGLMKVPVLGWLFKKHKEEERTDELLIFITPRVVEKP